MEFQLAEGSRRKKETHTHAHTTASIRSKRFAIILDESTFLLPSSFVPSFPLNARHEIPTSSSQPYISRHRSFCRRKETFAHMVFMALIKRLVFFFSRSRVTSSLLSHRFNEASNLLRNFYVTLRFYIQRNINLRSYKREDSTYEESIVIFFDFYLYRRAERGTRRRLRGVAEFNWT